jgi:lipopolysaccharide export system permease protein
LYSFIREDPNQNTFQQFSYAEWDSSYNLSLYVTARTALWQNNQWTLQDGQIKVPSSADPQKNSISLFQEKHMVLPEGPQNFFVPKYRVNEQSISTLYQEARANKIDPRRAWIDFNWRLSFLFIGLPLVLLGLPVLLVLYQRWGRDLSLAIPASCGLAIAAWGWWSTSQSLTRAYNINPFIAAWSVHLVIGIIGIWLLVRQDA